MINCGTWGRWVRNYLFQLAVLWICHCWLWWLVVGNTVVLAKSFSLFTSLSKSWIFVLLWQHNASALFLVAPLHSDWYIVSYDEWKTCVFRSLYDFFFLRFTWTRVVVREGNSYSTHKHVFPSLSGVFSIHECVNFIVIRENDFPFLVKHYYEENLPFFLKVYREMACKAHLTFLSKGFFSRIKQNWGEKNVTRISSN